MKRAKPLQRKTPLRPDPEKVREFLRRGRELERQTVAKARGGMRRARPEEGPLTPAAWRQAAFEASGGRCLMSSARARDVDDRRFHAHHCLPKRELRARGLLGYVWDPRNGIWLASDVHERHENAAQRVPAGVLPAAVWEFCAELDALEGSQWASMLVLRAHPPAGNSRISRGGLDGEG